MTTIPRIGFACKTVQPHPKRIFENIADLNFKGTTITWVKNQPRDVAERKLWEITEHNVQALKKLIEYVGGLDEHRRMVRIGSDIFSGYTHPELQFFWSQRSVLDMAARTLAEAGDIARDRNVRLSMHPGQFVVLASDTETIVNNSILEFEYHTLIAKLMGYGSSWHDHGFKINVHISGRQGPSGIRKALTKLSPEACNLITIENEENNYGIDTVLELADCVAIVLDIHHNWVKEGEYIRSNDDRIQRIVDSWRGVRPVFHYSLSREEFVIGHDPNVLPDRDQLIASGIGKQKLRAHSDFMWNNAANEWALEHLSWGDCMVEAKAKNLASERLYQQWEQM